MLKLGPGALCCLHPVLHAGIGIWSSMPPLPVPTWIRLWGLGWLHLVPCAGIRLWGPILPPPDSAHWNQAHTTLQEKFGACSNDVQDSPWPWGALRAGLHGTGGQNWLAGWGLSSPVLHQHDQWITGHFCSHFNHPKPTWILIDLLNIGSQQTKTQ